MAHPSGATYSTVHHLYSLYRGETPGSVQDIAFSPDARYYYILYYDVILLILLLFKCPESR